MSARKARPHVHRGRSASPVGGNRRNPCNRLKRSDGHTVDAKHFNRQEWIGRLLLLLLLGGPLVYILGVHFDIW